MLFERQGGDNCMIGFDLRDDCCQMSWCALQKDNAVQEPVTWSPSGKGDKFDIPTVLCRERGANRWYYGMEAAMRAADPSCLYLPHLLSQALAQEPVRTGDSDYDPEALLALFISRCLADLSEVLPGGVAAVMFTVRRMDGRTIDLLENIRGRLDLKCSLYYQSYGGSYYDFMLNQERELREPASVLFDCESGGKLKVSRLIFNAHTRPTVAFQEESEYPGLFAESDNGRDEEFCRILKSELGGRGFSSVYLIGSAFKGGWMRKAAAVMCQGGRRAFVGGNLYSKGGAYGAMLRTLRPPVLSEYLYLDSNKLRTNVLVLTERRGKQELVTLAEAGANWYEVSGSVDLILEGTGVIDLVLRPLTGGGDKPFRIRLDGLPVRGDRITRVRLGCSMPSSQRLRIRIEDLGFGETFPSSGLKWEQELRMNSDGQDIASRRA